MPLLAVRLPGLLFLRLLLNLDDSSGIGRHRALEKRAEFTLLDVLKISEGKADVVPSGGERANSYAAPLTIDGKIASLIQRLDVERRAQLGFIESGSGNANGHLEQLLEAGQDVAKPQWGVLRLDFNPRTMIPLRRRVGAQ